MARKEQRLIFTVTKNAKGMMNITMDFSPRLARSEEEFNAMPMDRREMQNLSMDLGRFAMSRAMEVLAKNTKSHAIINDLPQQVLNDSLTLDVLQQVKNIFVNSDIPEDATALINEEEIKAFIENAG